jgi:hypothetical protein
MEMVLDTRSAMDIYNCILTTKAALAMVKPSGALLAARFWLACRTLIMVSGGFKSIAGNSRSRCEQLYNVADGEGLKDVEAYVKREVIREAGGNKGAVVHWKKLHSHPERTPRFLKYFGGFTRKKFNELYARALTVLEPRSAGDSQMSEPDFVFAMRLVYDRLGLAVRGLKTKQTDAEGDWPTRVGVSMQLWAHLPLDEGIPTEDRAVFCPAAVIPTKEWMEDASNEARELELELAGDGLTIVSVEIRELVN